MTIDSNMFVERVVVMSASTVSRFSKTFPLWMEMCGWVDLSVACAQNFHTLVQMESCIAVGGSFLRVT